MTASTARGAGDRRRPQHPHIALQADVEARHADGLTQVSELWRLAGTATVEAHLTTALSTLARMRDIVPAQLRLRDELADLDHQDITDLANDLRPTEGPPQWLAAYLRAEQRHGRLRPDLNCDMTALCLLATLLGLALIPGPPPPDDLLAVVLEQHVTVLVHGARP